MFVRDISAMNIDTKLMVVMKGAPERILTRCSKILINGEELDFNDDFKAEVNFANGSLGKLGERVLAIARYNLEPEIYGKDY
jgi:sodium/potassium-transporting ATPase subunit alpha